MNSINKDFLIVQSNTLIEKKRFLSIDEQKIVLIFSSLISPEDDEFKVYEVEANKIMTLLEVKNQSKYMALKEAIYKLGSKPIKIEDEDSFEIMHWFSYAKYKDGIIKVKFTEELKPYLLGLKDFFTKYKLENVLHMKSKYSIQIYEMLKSNEFKKEIELSLDELREFLNIGDKYKEYKHLKQNILNKAKIEISEGQTDINFEFEEIKEGRKVAKIKFKIYNENRSIKQETIDKRDISAETKVKVDTLKSLFPTDIQEQDIIKILEVAYEDLAKVIEKFYIVKSKKKIDNFVGLMIDSIKKGL